MTHIQLVVAGPGAGKTEDLVHRVLEHLPQLEQHRFIAVITYTNAATQRIQERLQEHCRMPFNLFVGTIHSFLNKFILIPYSSVFALTPADLKFVEELIIAESQKKYRNFLIKKARDKGVIPYAQIEQISKKLILGGKLKAAESEVNIKRATAAKISALVARRFKCIFVDEYQDATVDQHEIFDGLINAGHIEYFHCVGDAEQYIYSFRYKDKAGTPPTFNEIPIKILGNQEGVEKRNISVNRRSTGTIVRFLNSFSDLQQTIPSDIGTVAPVTYLEGTELTNIVEKFEALRTELGLHESVAFYLSHSPKEVRWSSLPQLSELSSTGVQPNEIVRETMRYISSTFNRSTSALCNDLNISEVDLKMLAMETIRMIKDNPAATQEGVDAFLAAKLGLPANRDHKREDTLQRIHSFTERGSSDTKRKYSSIHKAKGLEAESVLVVAKNLKQLNTWLEMDREKREQDKIDQCRLGFVAFSRARQLLCIACLEPLNTATKQRLLQLQVTIS